METTILGVVLDSSVLIAAERRRLSDGAAIEHVRQEPGEVAIVISAVSIAAFGHGI